MASNLAFKTTIYLSLFCIISCAKEPSDPFVTPPKEFNQVDPRLWKYYERFEEEAKVRRIVIDLEKQRITGSIEKIPERGVAGSCSYGGSPYSDIIIDSEFWFRADTIYREMIIFHELGHCSLHRDHLESYRADGTCLSIMRSGNGGCIDNYNRHTRDQYIDELFENY